MNSALSLSVCSIVKHEHIATLKKIYSLFIIIIIIIIVIEYSVK